MAWVLATTELTQNETRTAHINHRHSSARVAESILSNSGAIITNHLRPTISANRLKYLNQWHKAGSSGTSRQKLVPNGTFSASSMRESSRIYHSLVICVRQPSNFAELRNRDDYRPVSKNVQADASRCEGRETLYYPCRIQIIYICEIWFQMNLNMVIYEHFLVSYTIIGRRNDVMSYSTNWRIITPIKAVGGLPEPRSGDKI